MAMHKCTTYNDYIACQNNANLLLVLQMQVDVTFLNADLLEPIRCGQAAAWVLTASVKLRLRLFAYGIAWFTTTQA